ncbi:MAG: hypothetical protein N3A69_17390, partial [Leptospiraceae bacterium]|nr:hypothetical protein [Leptospiraceae bacterium]
SNLSKTEENAQLERMKQANKTIHSLLGDLTQVQNKLEILKKSIWKLSSYPQLKSNFEITNLIENIGQTLNAVEFQLKEKVFYNEADLKSFLQDIIQKLDLELSHLDEVFKKTKL